MNRTKLAMGVKTASWSAATLSIMSLAALAIGANAAALLAAVNAGCAGVTAVTFWVLLRKAGKGSL